MILTALEENFKAFKPHFDQNSRPGESVITKSLGARWPDGHMGKCKKNMAKWGIPESKIPCILPL